MALWGWNTIRVGCAYPGGSDASVFNGQRWSWPDSNDLDAIVAAYSAQGVVVIIANVQRVTGTFLDTAQRNAEVTWWTDIANRYKGYPNVWFDLTVATGQQLGSLTQPVVLDSWYTQTVDLINAIRATGARNIIVARGTNDGQDNLETTAGTLVLDTHSAILSKGQAVTGIDHDVVFGLVTHHYWGVGNATQNNAKLTDYITRVQNKGLALLVISTGGLASVDGLAATNTVEDQLARATRATYAVAPGMGVGVIAWHAQPGDQWALTNATKTWPDGDVTGDFANTNAGLTWHGQLMYELLNAQPAPTCPVANSVSASYNSTTREATATATVTNGGSGVTYTYDWGDGVVTTSNVTSSVHAYSVGQTGVRTITVTARKTGCSNSVATTTVDLGGTGGGSGVEVAFRSASSGNNGAGSTTLTLNKPSGVVADDTMIASVAVPATTSGGGGGGGVQTLIEAETIVQGGGKTDLPNEAYWSGYQGSGYKANWGNWDPGSDGTYIIFDYTAPTTGDYTFEVRYSAGNGNAPRALLVDGTTVDAAWNFPGTADWDTWATVSRTLTLTAGARQVRLQLPASNIQYVNLDWVRFTSPVTGGTTNVTVTPPAGWTQITDSTSTSTGVRLYTYRKVVANGDPASWNWTLSSSVRAAGGISAYANVDGVSPIDGSSSTAVVGPGTSHTTPTVTPSGTGRVEVSIAAVDAVSTFTAGSGTERFDQASTSGTGNVSLALYDQSVGTAPAPTCPVISSFTNSIVQATKTVTVTLSASNLTGATITYDWGDGTTTPNAGTTASHVYATTGNKTIGVTIVKAGCTDATSSTAANLTSTPPPTGSNFQVSGTQILAPNGSVFVPYGGNILGEHAFWPQGSTLGLVSTVKNTWGFNCVGVCNAAPGGIPDPGDGWGRFDWTEVTLDQVISTYTAQGIVCIVRLISNNSGDWLRDIGTGTDSIGTLSLDQAGDWFANYGNQYKNNPYVWWNTLSEPGTGQLDKWEYQHNYIIDRLRGVGANQPIVATATWWGQDNAQYDTSFVSEATSSVLQKGQAILAHDPVHNVIMDLHCYNTYGFGGNQAQATAKVADYFDRVHAKGLAIMCLEFGGYGNNGDPALMQAALGAIAAAPSRGIGLVWWHLQPGDGFSLTDSGDLADIGNLTTCGQAFWNIHH